jgi:ferredoxin
VNRKKNTDVTIKVPSNKFILDVAEQQAVGIPYSCRAGSCSSCIGRLKQGTVDQSGQIFLEGDKIDQGFILTCVAYPTSDLIVEVDIEDEFYNTINENV